MQASPIFTEQNFKNKCDKLASSHPAFARIIASYGYPPVWARPASFETLIHIILEQQVSLASALAAFNKLKTFVQDITPQQILLLSSDDLKACYFSRQKIIYVQHLSTLLVEKKLDLAHLTQLDNDAVAAQLMQVKGIGIWTANIYLMMAMHRADCFPPGDIALIKSMRHELELPATISNIDLYNLAENWKPYRTIAAYLLWHAYLRRIDDRRNKKSTKVKN